jgi:hypothetical protein
MAFLHDEEHSLMLRRLGESDQSLDHGKQVSDDTSPSQVDE